MAWVESTLASVGSVPRFHVVLDDSQPTVVSYRKLLKEYEKKHADQAPAGANPALEARMGVAGAELVTKEAKSQPPASSEPLPAPPNRFSAVIEKIERLYRGGGSDDDEDEDENGAAGAEVATTDQYDTDDSFIDDSDLDDYFADDRAKTKHKGFFVNRGKLEKTTVPELKLVVKKTKKRRSQEGEKPGGERGGGQGTSASKKTSKVGDRSAGEQQLGLAMKPCSRASDSRVTGSVKLLKRKRTRLLSLSSLKESGGTPVVESHEGEEGDLPLPEATGFAGTDLSWEEFIVGPVEGWENDVHEFVLALGANRRSAKVRVSEDVQAVGVAGKPGITKKVKVAGTAGKTAKRDKEETHLIPDVVVAPPPKELIAGAEGVVATPRELLAPQGAGTKASSLTKKAPKAGKKRAKEGGEEPVTKRAKDGGEDLGTKSPGDDQVLKRAGTAKEDVALQKALGELSTVVSQMCRGKEAVVKPEADGGEQLSSAKKGILQLPMDVRHQLAKVARLAATEAGRVPDGTLSQLNTMLGHIVDRKTLKRNLTKMVKKGKSAKEEKEGRLLVFKSELRDAVGTRISERKISDEQGPAAVAPDGSPKESGEPFAWDEDLEDKVVNIAGVTEEYIEGTQEHKGAHLKKLYKELTELWPVGVMDTGGIKSAIKRAKQRQRQRRKLLEKKGSEKKRRSIGSTSSSGPPPEKSGKSSLNKIIHGAKIKKPTLQLATSKANKEAREDEGGAERAREAKGDSDETETETESDAEAQNRSAAVRQAEKGKMKRIAPIQVTKKTSADQPKLSKKATLAVVKHSLPLKRSEEEAEEDLEAEEEGTEDDHEEEEEDNDEGGTGQEDGEETADEDAHHSDDVQNEGDDEKSEDDTESDEEGRPSMRDLKNSELRRDRGGGGEATSGGILLLPSGDQAPSDGMKERGKGKKRLKKVAVVNLSSTENEGPSSGEDVRKEDGVEVERGRGHEKMGGRGGHESSKLKLKLSVMREKGKKVLDKGGRGGLDALTNASEKKKLKKRRRLLNAEQELASGSMRIDLSEAASKMPLLKHGGVGGL